jgi:sterol desaturase/sphingolipid hydroxylase (fatty acid hydroxylase superfamily)
VNEVAIRLGIFLGVLALMAMLERRRPKRTAHHPRATRWVANLGIGALGSLAERALAGVSQVLAVPLVAIGAAELAATRGWGLLNAWDGPGWARIAIGLLALDFALYLQHLASHKIGLLWRLHRVHHADPDVDVTTAVRFHPIEIALSMLYKVAWVLVLGAPAGAVLAFEVLLSACSLFNHANLDLPGPLERILRLVVVTPDMHRVHHSVEQREHDSNYGFNLSLWDRLFATYTAEPAAGHDGMAIGLTQYPGPPPTRLGWSLALPFRGR